MLAAAIPRDAPVSRCDRRSRKHRSRFRGHELQLCFRAVSRLLWRNCWATVRPARSPPAPAPTTPMPGTPTSTSTAPMRSMGSTNISARARRTSPTTRTAISPPTARPRIPIRLDLADIRTAKKSNRVSGAGALAHEVTNGIDDRRAGQFRSLPDLFDRELRAYSVQSMVDEYTGSSTNFWYPGISGAERRRRVEWGAHASCASIANKVQPGQFPNQSCVQ